MRDIVRVWGGCGVLPISAVIIEDILDLDSISNTAITISRILEY
jgi:hypothetical protein